jgi:hypothetical protein
MKLPTTVRILLRSILGPLFAVFLVSKINIFDFITFVPDDVKLEAGLTVYLAFFEAIFLIIEKIAENNCAAVTCVFFTRESEADINNTPSISCSLGTASIKCRITLAGSARILRSSSLLLALPVWLSSQIEKSNQIMQYENQAVLLPFDIIIPNSNRKKTEDVITVSIPFIQNMDDGILTNVLKPELKVTIFKKYLINYRTNGFKISNKEEQDA